MYTYLRLLRRNWHRISIVSVIIHFRFNLNIFCLHQLVFRNAEFQCSCSFTEYSLKKEMYEYVRSYTKAIMGLTNWITLLPIQLVIDVITLRWFIHNSSPSRNTWGCQAQNWIFFTVMDHKKVMSYANISFLKKSSTTPAASNRRRQPIKNFSVNVVTAPVLE